jgi:hypothetical protein
MPELFFVGIVICIGWYFFNRMERKSKYEIGDTAVYFEAEKLLIAFSNIISLERDISSGKAEECILGISLLTILTLVKSILSECIWR